MGSVSTVSAVKWLWFLINVTALAGVLVHLARVFKAGADAKGGEVAQLYGEIMQSIWPSFSNQHVERCESFAARAFFVSEMRVLCRQGGLDDHSRVVLLPDCVAVL